MEDVLFELRVVETAIRRVRVRFEARQAHLDEARGHALSELERRRDELLGQVIGDLARRRRQKEPLPSSPHADITLRTSPPAIVLLEEEPTVISKLRARGLTSAIRTVEQVDKRVLLTLSDEDLRLAGVRREQHQDVRIRLPDGTSYTLELKADG